MLSMPGQVSEHLNLKCDFHKEMKHNKDTFMELLKKILSLIPAQFSQGIKNASPLATEDKPVHYTSVWMGGRFFSRG